MNRILFTIIISAFIATIMQGCTSGRFHFREKTVEERFTDEINKTLIINKKHPNRTNPLEGAIINNDTELALFITSHYPQYVFMLNDSGWSNLFNAVNAKNITVMRALLKAGAIKIRGRLSPLICAVTLASDENAHDKAEESKCWLMVNELLAAGADVNECEFGDISPIFVARNARLAALLIARGADVNVASSSGTTPLMLASFDGDIERTKLLLDHGADPYRRASEYGATALSIARQEGHREIIALLKAYMMQHPPAKTLRGK